ncbi:NUDIX domain-containing protein [Dyadobacter sp. CY261]|uniref:NUDIX hydrolase n=1 Tax=Dyadobacter sp. CY261 TaxID=2907203 RepID=UPI001F258604|nr:NUDIX domain-containing protein [Dyadobacter sp. CY261]MCF0069427.1 NUDIX domain-containing protein [Dyadobacter sp. CY261]
MEHNLKEFFDKALKEVSLDCTVFGFHEGELKVLLLRWKGTDEWSLPGGHILLDESADDAANRILTQRTGLNDIFLQQFYTFGNVNRYVYHSEKELLEKLEATFGKGFFDGIIFRRVVSIGYFALVEFDQVQPTPDWFTDECRWWSLSEIPNLLFDHNEMVDRALKALRQRIRNQPVGYNLLPEKFTMPELQRLYETILGRQFDRRNFQKLLMSYDILERLDEKRVGAANKSPYLYRFVKEKYERAVAEGVSFAM